MADKTTRGRAVGAEGLTAVADGGPWLGDAIHFFLSAKRAGGRRLRTVDDYRKKLELFQRWIARRLGGDDAVDVPYTDIGADEVEAYVVYSRTNAAWPTLRGRTTCRSLGASSRPSPGG